MLKPLLIIMMSISLSAFAAKKDKGDKDREKGGKDRKEKSGGGGNNPACKVVRDACEKAGYTAGRKGGGLGPIKECVQNWSSGEPIKGVTLKTTDPSAKECYTHLKSRSKDKGKGKDKAGAVSGAPAAKPGTVSGAAATKAVPPAKAPAVAKPVPPNAPKVLPAIPQPAHPAATPPPPKNP